MTSAWQHKRGGWYVSVSTVPGCRVSIYLGRCTKAQAANVARKIGLLVAGNKIGEPPAGEIAGWLSLLSAEFLNRLDAVGLLQNWNRPTTAPLFTDFWTQYVNGRTDFSTSTIKGFGTAYKHASTAFAGLPLDSITVAAAKQFARDLEKTCASSHAKKILERTKQIFAAAIDSRLIDANPFDGLSIVARIDRTRQQYVSPETAAVVIDKFCTLEARALFALARYCGLRVPHEPLTLTWNCVDWELERIRIPDNTKTGWRVCPLFRPALVELEQLFNSVAPGPYVFNRARGSAATTWRDWLLAAIQSANLQPWPKLWHNLRASCRTDLESQFPAGVCNAWLGHSTRVAIDHYHLVTPDHWATARGNAPRTARDDAHGAPHGNETF